MSDKERMMIQLQELDQEIKQLNNHLEQIDEQLTELQTSKIILNKFAQLNKGDELRVPLSSGIYCKATLIQSDEVMVNVGSGVTVEKSPEDVTKILDGQVQELQSYREKHVNKMRDLIGQIEELQKQVS